MTGNTTMNKLYAKPIAAAVLALSALLAAAPAAAEDGLAGHAVTALGIAIAAQGDAALVQIREEVKQIVLERIRPYLPERKDVVPDEKPAPAPGR
jgi:hypothetical protein